MNNPIKQMNLETKIIHRKPNEWIPTGRYEEYYGQLYKCPFCEALSLEADRFCNFCGKIMTGGNIEDDE